MSCGTYYLRAYFFMGKKINILNKVFGRWTVIKDLGKVKQGVHCKWLCICECGTFRNVIGKDLRNGKSISCGCYQIEVIKRVMTTHGQSRSAECSPEYESWCGMKARCYNINNSGYKDYGGRGIYVCDRWLGENGFSNFLHDMGKKPSPIHSIDRFPNNQNGIYEPTNCRWATPTEQNRNRRSNRWILYNGENKILDDWAKQFKTPRSNLCTYLRSHTFEEAYNFYVFKIRRKRRNI